MIRIAHMGVEMVEGTIGFPAVGVVAAIMSLHLSSTAAGLFTIWREIWWRHFVHLVQIDGHNNAGDWREQAMGCLYGFVRRIHTRILTRCSELGDAVGEP